MGGLSQILWVGPTCIQLSLQEGDERNTQRREQCEERAGGWSDVATSQEKLAGTRSWKNQDRNLSTLLCRECGPVRTLIWGQTNEICTSDFLNCERRHFCCVKLLVLWSFITTAIGNEPKGPTDGLSIRFAVEVSQPRGNLAKFQPTFKGMLFPSEVLRAPALPLLRCLVRNKLLRTTCSPVPVIKGRPRVWPQATWGYLVANAKSGLPI